MDKREENPALKKGTGGVRLLSVFLTSLLVVGNALFTAYADRCFLNPRDSMKVVLLKAIVYTLVFAGGTAAVLKAADLLKRRQENAAPPRFFRMRWYSVLFLALLFAAVYMLYLQIYWPGVCGHDTCNQIKDLVTGLDPLPYNWINGSVRISALMNDHHPVLTTLIFTAFYRLGLQLGSAETGMYLYCIVQIVIMSCAFSLFVCSMTGDGVPAVIAAAASVFYCMPFVAFYAISMLKDSLFSLVFFLWTLCYVSVLRKGGTGDVGRARWALFLFLSALSALTNKKGMYIVFLSSLFLIPLCRNIRDRLMALLSALVPALLVVVLLGRILFPLLNIYPGGTQEALGFAFQQTALTYMEDPGSFTEDDKDVLRHVIGVDPDEYAGVYDRSITDRIKDRYNYYADREDLLAYLRLWLRQGLQHPSAYVRATLMVNGGFFVPGESIIVYNEAVWYDSIGAFRQPEERSVWREDMDRFYQWLCTMPLTAILFNNVLYLWWTPLLALVLLVRERRWRLIAALVPTAANIVFLVMGPVCWTRYGLCQLYTVPVLWTLPFLRTPVIEEREEHSDDPAEDEKRTVGLN